MTLTAEEAQAAWDKLAVEEEAKPKKAYRHYVPLTEGCIATISEAQDPHRIHTGIRVFDDQMRGVGRGHLLNIVGYSHSGKTLVLLGLLLANKGKRIAYFCPDETMSLVLTKLTAIITGIPSRELESRVGAGDQDAIDLLYATATVHFPHLAVFEGALSAQMMTEAYDELTDVWDDEPDMVIVDYVDLFDGGGDTAMLKFNWLKAFGKSRKVPMVLIHQTSRSAGADGKAMTISSGNFGGEQHATFQIGVRRKKNAIMHELAEQYSKATPNLERIDELKHDLLWHEYTITLNLTKNKRPGGQTVDEIDFELDIETGAIHELALGEPPNQWVKNHSLEAKRRQEALEQPTAVSPMEMEGQLGWDDVDGY